MNIFISEYILKEDNNYRVCNYKYKDEFLFMEYHPANLRLKWTLKSGDKVIDNGSLRATEHYQDRNNRQHDGRHDRAHDGRHDERHDGRHDGRHDERHDGRHAFSIIFTFLTNSNIS